VAPLIGGVQHAKAYLPGSKRKIVAGGLCCLDTCDRVLMTLAWHESSRHRQALNRESETGSRLCHRHLLSGYLAGPYDPSEGFRPMTPRDQAVMRN
jgi:hypothetical protein